jgi:hypothetical protein
MRPTAIITGACSGLLALRGVFCSFERWEGAGALVVLVGGALVGAFVSTSVAFGLAGVRAPRVSESRRPRRGARRGRPSR